MYPVGSKLLNFTDHLMNPMKPIRRYLLFYIRFRNETGMIFHDLLRRSSVQQGYDHRQHPADNQRLTVCLYPHASIFRMQKQPDARLTAFHAV